MIDAQRISGALEVLTVCLAGTASDPVRWGLAWRDALAKIDVRLVSRSCREIRFEGTDREKREASFVGRMVNRGHEYAKQVDEIEASLQDLYPADEARRRLDGDLGWDHGPHDSMPRKLDRSMMKARVNAPAWNDIRYRAHKLTRSRFADLEGMANLED